MQQVDSRRRVGRYMSSAHKWLRILLAPLYMTHVGGGQTCAAPEGFRNPIKGEPGHKSQA